MRLHFVQTGHAQSATHHLTLPECKTATAVRDAAKRLTGSNYKS